MVALEDPTTGTTRIPDIGKTKDACLAKAIRLLRTTLLANALAPNDIGRRLPIFSLTRQPEDLRLLSCPTAVAECIQSARLCSIRRTTSPAVLD